MTDRSASSQRSTLLNSAVPETPSLNEKQFLHQLKPVLLPPSKNGAKQPIGSRKPRLLSPELPAGSKEEGCRSPSRKHQFHFWLGKKDFLFLQDQAQEEGESVARIIRRLVREFRINAENRPTPRW